MSHIVRVCFGGGVANGILQFLVEFSMQPLPALLKQIAQSPYQRVFNNY